MSIKAWRIVFLFQRSGNYIIYRKMTEEQNSHDKYILCSKCNCKYINDEEHVSTYFGYTRLEERYTTC